jgi:hypothetical protein
MRTRFDIYIVRLYYYCTLVAVKLPMFMVSAKCIDALDFFNAWFQTLEGAINGIVVFRMILILVILVNHEIHENLSPLILIISQYINEKVDI